jgi:hypothetical protein
MNITTLISDINWLAVAVASVSAFAIGGLWYSPVLFSKAWQKESKLTDQEIKNSNMVMIFGMTFVLMFISAVVLDIFIPREATATVGLVAGLLVGIGWVATSMGVNYLFARKSFRLYLIDAGYFVVLFAVMGLILGAW